MPGHILPHIPKAQPVNGRPVAISEDVMAEARANAAQALATKMEESCFYHLAKAIVQTRQIVTDSSEPLVPFDRWSETEQNRIKVIARIASRMPDRDVLRNVELHCRARLAAEWYGNGNEAPLGIVYSRLTKSQQTEINQTVKLVLRIAGARLGDGNFWPIGGDERRRLSPEVTL